MQGSGVGDRGSRAAEAVLEILREVKDPEVPVLDIVELGIVRGAEVEGDRVTVRITPTYSGCPAMQVIEREIEAALRRHGYAEVAVETVFQPAWTTEWMGESAREKLRVYGIAPPGRVEAQELVPLGTPPRPVPCPYCGSSDTVRVSEFGATACKSIHSCRSCRQPFEHFKAI
jgi:ring-1,2-phenylacetyl-CoA epoxidase subunit PaaD